MKDQTTTSRSLWFVAVIMLIIPVVASMPFMNGMPPGFVLYKSASTWGHCNNLVMSACSAQWDYCSCNRPVFNVTTIPSNVTELWLGDIDHRGRWDRAKCPPSCLLDTSAPLPYRRNLTAIALYDFWVAPADGPFPVGRFLKNFKTTVTKLTLHTIHLPSITRDTFAGFAALETLRLANNRIVTITVDAFASLRAPDKIPGILSTPRLHFIMLEDNNLTAVDWTIFEPLAASLKTIALSGNNIESIYFSHFFTLPGIEYVSLPGNSLTGITDQLLRSVAPYDLRPFLNIQFNPMCPVDVQCRCSSMDNLWDWYGKSPRLYRRLLPPGSTDCLNYPQADYFTCGNYSVLEYEPASSRFQNVLEATSGKSYQRCEAMDFANIARGAKSKARNPFGQLFPPTLGDYFLKMAAALEKTS